jgi:hypothetical protein
MGLTKRSDSYYVEFRVTESEGGKSLWRAEYRKHGKNDGKLGVSTKQ